jgi:A/G-specific adenine glycosylase
MWEGLGYYSRAVNAHKAARVIVRDLDGDFPRTREGLESLPGIGSYTAGAILSMAFGQDEPAVDANAVRVVTRLFDVDEPPARSSVKARIESMAREIIPPGKAAEINQALMDLGSLICRPKSPLCESCPLAEECEARFLNVVMERPLRPAAMKTTPVLMVTGVLLHKGLFFVQKRPAQGVWASLWEFPGGRIENGETPESGIIREYAEETGFDVEVADGLGVIRHAYTRYRVTMHAFLLRLRQAPETPQLTAATEYLWAGPEELEKLPMPSAQRKLMLRLREKGIIPNKQ